MESFIEESEELKDGIADKISFAQTFIAKSQRKVSLLATHGQSQVSLSVSSSSPQLKVSAPQLTPSQSQINANMTATEAHVSLPQTDSIVASVADHSHSSAL